MKIWKKIFLYSVVLTMVLINLVGIIMINSVHKKNLDRVISDTINMQRNISNSIYLNYDINEYKYLQNYDISAWLNMILKNYVYTDKGNIKNIQVFDEEKKVVASLNKYNNNYDINDILASNGNEEIFSIKKVNNERVLVVSSGIKIKNKNLKLILTRSIEFLYEDMIKNYKIFIILDIIMNVLLIIGMYIISRQITKPIVNLTNTSVEIASGEYSKRAIVLSKKDEIGTLSQNFNLMMEVLESKIQELKDINDEKERFINNLTHEMKTPITSIIGYSDILLKGNINEDIKLKSLDYINSEAKRLENLSSALIKLTLIKNNHPEKDIISIKECMKNVNRSLSYKLREKNIDLSIDIEDVNIIADKSLIIILLNPLC
nr:HAMP domain-containing sensor histidine kinase [uncultured Romboutsia sp.]